MECAGIREYLSEYVDGTLDPQNRALVEEHLSTCEHCREELSSLRAVIEELGSLEPLSAPENFLRSIHERIENRSAFSRVKRLLFFPARIKIPLQLATAAVTALLVFTVFNAMQPAKQFPGKPSVSDQERVAQQPASEPMELASIEKGMKSRSEAGSRLAPGTEAEREALQLALWIDAEPFHLDHAADESVKETELDKQAPAVEEKGSAMTLAPKRALRMQEAPEARLKKSRLKDEKEAPAGAERETIPDEALSRVTDLIGSFGGKVVSVRYAGESGSPQSIRADIPNRNYSPFLEKLNRIGTLQLPLPSMPAGDREMVQIEILLLSHR